MAKNRDESGARASAPIPPSEGDYSSPEDRNGEIPIEPSNHPEDSAVLEMMRTRAMELKNKGTKKLPLDDDFRGRFPNVWAYITATQLSEAVTKEPAAITFSVQGTSWALTLRDAALKQSCSVIGNTFLEALQRLDKAIPHGDTVWQLWRDKGEALRFKKLPGE